VVLCVWEHNQKVIRMPRKAKLDIKEREVTLHVPQELMKSTMEDGVISITLSFDDFDMDLDRKAVARVMAKNWKKLEPELSMMEKMALKKWMKGVLNG